MILAAIICLVSYCIVLIFADNKKYIYIMFASIAMIFSSAFCGSSLTKNSGYSRGQIDAINGKIMYELVTQDDNTTKWVEIKETK